MEQNASIFDKLHLANETPNGIFIPIYRIIISSNPSWLTKETPFSSFFVLL